jgi:hypothetical protein
MFMITVPQMSQGTVINAQRSFYFVAVIYQPKKDNDNQHMVDKILEEYSART